MTSCEPNRTSPYSENLRSVGTLASQFVASYE